jgi:hypothetical protein
MTTTVFFVDALPFDQKEAFGISPPQGVRIQPVPGYSPNIDALLFHGKNPDEVGFFNIWNRHTNGINPSILHHVLDVHPIVLRVYRKIMNKLLSNNLNIPLRFEKNFSKTEFDCFDPNNEDNVVRNARIFWQGDMKKSAKMEQEAFHALQQGSDVCVGFSSIDTIGHNYGTQSSEFATEIQRLARLFKKFEEKSDRIFLVSDHGMITVQDKLDFNFFHYLKNGDAIFFIDSTMIRIWKTGIAKPAVVSALEKTLHLFVLTEKDRKEFGMTSKEFGDYIFMCQKGFVFAPNFFGLKIPVGMHGYLENTTDNCGVFYDSKNTSNEKEFITYKEIYRRLKSAL